MTGPDQQPESTGALDGLRVVDLTTTSAAPSPRWRWRSSAPTW